MSHLDWVDSLPRGWEAKPLRSTVDYVVSNVDKVPADDEIPVRLCNYTDVYKNEFITLALEFMQATATKDEISKFGLRVDDVVITKDSESWDDIGVPALVRETASDLVCGYHLALLRPHKQDMDGTFLFRCLQARPVRVQLELAANGVTRFGIPKSEIGAMTLPVPPLVQQRAIADYLDRETMGLDALVAAKERVLGLLAEKRRALITRAVTRGLDTRAPLRDSGIPWLGEIPAHWRVMRAGLAGHILMGRQRAPQYEKGSHMTPYLRVANVFDSFIDYSDVLEMNFEPEEQALFGLTPGDVLLNEGQSRELVGRSAIYREGAGKYCFQNTLIRFRCAKDLCPAFAQVQFASWLGRGVFQAFSRQSTNIAHLGADRLAQIHMVVPPVGEQEAIIAHIEREAGKADSMRAATERTIALLKERRSALISAAVTGQIHVGNAA